jgi:hypothetical protein
MFARHYLRAIRIRGQVEDGKLTRFSDCRVGTDHRRATLQRAGAHLAPAPRDIPYTAAVRLVVCLHGSQKFAITTGRETARRHRRRRTCNRPGPVCDKAHHRRNCKRSSFRFRGWSRLDRLSGALPARRGRVARRSDDSQRERLLGGGVPSFHARLLLLHGTGLDRSLQDVALRSEEADGGGAGPIGRVIDRRPVDRNGGTASGRGRRRSSSALGRIA